MKFDSALMARLQAATQRLMKDGPLAATASIQQALKGGAPEPDTRAPEMKDLNEAPAFARQAKPRAETKDTQQTKETKPAAPHIDIAAILAKAGVTLPEGVDLPGAQRRPPAPPLPPGARFLASRCSVSAGARDYRLYVPSTYNNEPMPLVVMLHGCTQNPEDFAAGTRMNELAEVQGFLVAYPGQTQTANSSRCWNWFSPADQRRGHGEPAIIAAIVQHVMTDFRVDPRRVSIAGLSAGGAMAVIVAELYPEVFSAVGVHSGLPVGAASDLQSALQAMKRGPATGHGGGLKVPTIVFHGDKDHTVNAKNGHAIVGNRADGTPTVERGHVAGGRKYTRTVHANGNVEHWVIHGAGHAWAGGSASGTYTDGKGPDASREMVRFFAEVAASR